MNNTLKELDTIAVENFRQYLRIPSVHPNVNYEPCVEFLEKLSKSIGLQFTVFRDVPDNPTVVVTWMGKDKTLSTIMLNSHMDVVPVFEDKWTHKPFDADIDENGNIYGRGAQDCKCLGIQYLEAIRRLIKNDFQPRRTVHVTFMPDEEVGGGNGAGMCVTTDNFKRLNVGFALDEGGEGVGNTLVVYYGEKKRETITVHCTGQSGHGSSLLENTAGEKLRFILGKFYDYRAEQKKKENEEQRTDNITTLNLTMVKGGVQHNVIPDEFVLGFDARIPPKNVQEFETTINGWCKDAGEGVWIDPSENEAHGSTSLTDSNIFWVAFKKAAREMGFQTDLRILHANTDGRYFRKALIPTIGFSPNLNTPVKAHQNDEFLNINVFLEGIRIYVRIITALADA
ncbi:hypothetical protein RI129_013098 [Pyrocoelia pectoralis]|uniref:N-acyl-aliphatic-L-amino acid amidohydrolase n=1 Tax=Pyrocoelia pectoralis TaxID=417401 RepID=A0AAN7V115_9COLE